MAIATARRPNGHGIAAGGPRGGRGCAPEDTSCAAPVGGRDDLAELPLRSHAHHVPDEAAGLQAAYDQRRGIELPATEAVPRRRRERVVVVVPRLPEGGKREPEHVA